MFSKLKDKKLQKIAFENGKQVLICRGVLAWQAFQVYQAKKDEESEKSFKSLMKSFYFGKFTEYQNSAKIIYIPYSSIVDSRKRIAKKINKELSARGVGVKEMLQAYSEEIIETEKWYL